MMLAALALTATLTQQAIQGDPAAVRSMRTLGQPAVDALIKAGAPDRVLDAVCKQRDCRWSGLYWHTDLEQAKREARYTGKPILSLRLLGNLDEELSCANSRFFRTLLYSNREIRAFLRANYVLHWKSERPAPRITIDFGDGRRMQRTVTGNSIHYVVDARGRVLDAIPGLYSAPSFLSLLKEGAALHRTVVRGDPHMRDLAVSNYHANVRYAARRKRGGMPFAAMNDYGTAREDRLAAWTAGALAPSKSGGEAPLIDRVSFDARVRGFRDEMVKLVRETIAGPSTIDGNSKAMIRAKRASAAVPAASFEPMLEWLEKSIAADEKINEQQLRPKLHSWLANGLHDVEELNRVVYAELFLSPKEDPWMGLVSDVTFTGIQGEGLTVARQ